MSASLLLLNITLLLLLYYFTLSYSIVEDVDYTVLRSSTTTDNDKCKYVANVGDHVLLEYAVLINGFTVIETIPGSQLYHTIVDSVDRGLFINNVLIGMCLNSTVNITLHTNTASLKPLDIRYDLSLTTDPISIYIKLHHVTTPYDYQIFDAIESNASLAMDLIKLHVGINSYDQWGQTPLMIATISNKVAIITSLFNTVRPAVDVTLKKSVNTTYIKS